MIELKFDLRQFCYLQVLVEADLKKCNHCDALRCGLSQEQCDSYKRVKKEVFELLKNA